MADERDGADEDATVEDGGPSRLQRFFEHWKIATGIPLTALGLMTAWFAVEDRFWPREPAGGAATTESAAPHGAEPRITAAEPSAGAAPDPGISVVPPSTGLEIASFDAQSVSLEAESWYESDGSGPRDSRDEPTASVSVGLRNRGDAPVFLTHVLFTFRAHENLLTCVAWGDEIYTSQVVDVNVPRRPPADIPWHLEIPISHGIDPNGIDRLEFAFGMDEWVPFVEPAIVSVDIAVVEDDDEDPTPVGTARLVVPAMGARLSLSSLTGSTPVEPWDGCADANLAAMRRIEAAETLARADSSPEFEEMLEAYEAYQDGELYVFP